jgi:hypothetical protein
LKGGGLLPPAGFCPRRVLCRLPTGWKKGKPSGQMPLFQIWRKVMVMK